MSAIDQYQATCIGIIECPTPYRLFQNAQPTVLRIALYVLEQDIPVDETGFQGKRGDLLIGGGSGEAPAMRLTLPEAILFYTNYDLWEQLATRLMSFEHESTQVIAKAYWTMSEAFKLGAGFVRLGWKPDEESVESWLTQHILSFLLKYYPDDYQEYFGVGKLEYDGSICRVLTEEEAKTLNWKKR